VPVQVVASAGALVHNLPTTGCVVGDPVKKKFDPVRFGKRGYPPFWRIVQGVILVIICPLIAGAHRWFAILGALVGGPSIAVGLIQARTTD
jgi:hypothetical protein